MTKRASQLRKIEYGDFQTPEELARQVCAALVNSGVAPRSVLEPTCGIGRFLAASVDAFGGADLFLGVDVNATYLCKVRQALPNDKVSLFCGNLFDQDWSRTIRRLPQPVLIIGNPPWVTNAGLGAIGGRNLPRKSNFHGRSGMDAITGKSNFDISEWLVIKLLEALGASAGVVAMLVKTAVARKVLSFAWNRRLPLTNSSIYRIDAARHFGVAVDACLFICRTGTAQACCECDVYENLEDSRPERTMGFRDRCLVADVRAYDGLSHLTGSEYYTWRSGIKHDCSRVMELRMVGDTYFNGFGERVAVDEELLYPFCKSSDLNRGDVTHVTRRMIVTQKQTGEDTGWIRDSAKATWAYLSQYAKALDGRSSAIYRNRPRFSIFGVGPYTFAPWKVAVSGFYKTVRFRVVGSQDHRPIVLDDTVYFIPCSTHEEAELNAELLNSAAGRSFLEAFVFWDAKRPITIDVLRRLDLLALARANGKETQFLELAAHSSWVQVPAVTKDEAQQVLFVD